MPRHRFERLKCAPVRTALAGAFVAISVGAGGPTVGANVPPVALNVAGLAGAPTDFAWRCSAGLHQTVIATTDLRQRRVTLAPKLCRWLTEQQTDPRRFGIAVHIVIHEASHTRGLREENEAEDRAQLLTPRILGRYLHGAALERALHGAALVPAPTSLAVPRPRRAASLHDRSATALAHR